MDPTPESGSSSTIASPDETQLDLESQKAPSHVSHLKLVFDPAGVDARVLDHNYPGAGTADSPYIVDFLPEDPHNPLRFSNFKKWSIAIQQAIATLAVAFVSTAYSGDVGDIILSFGVSTEVAILGISLFVLGFAIGPLLWAPLSGTFVVLLSRSQ